MNKTLIYLFLSLMIIIIVIFVALDFRSNRPGRLSGNPYKLDMEELSSVDPSLISYRESRVYDIGTDEAAGLALHGDRIYVAADRNIRVISREGELIRKVALPRPPSCLDPNEQGDIIVAYRNGLAMFSPEGKELWTSDTLDSRSVFTCVKVSGSIIYVADAGRRAVHRFGIDGSLLGTFEGRTAGDSGSGFIVPSPNFDLDLTPDGELWVVNPGKHSIENYTAEGELRSYWENGEASIEGFTGCCNPAHMAIMEDGSFVTSEKGVVRIKIHKPSGKFASVVAPPDKFREDGKAPDIAVDKDGSVYALDFDRGMIRVFEPV